MLWKLFYKTFVLETDQQKTSTETLQEAVIWRQNFSIVVTSFWVLEMNYSSRMCLQGATEHVRRRRRMRLDPEVITQDDALDVPDGDWGMMDHLNSLKWCSKAVPNYFTMTSILKIATMTAILKMWHHGDGRWRHHEDNRRRPSSHKTEQVMLGRTRVLWRSDKW